MVYMNSKSPQIVPFIGNVMIPDMPVQYPPLLKGPDFCPFLIHLRNWNSIQQSTIGTLELNNEINGSMTDFTVENRISEPLPLDIIWDNAYNIGPEFGEIRFLVRNDFLNANLMKDSVLEPRYKPALHGISLAPRGCQAIHVIWKAGPKYKQLGTYGAPTSLGFLTLLPQRSHCCLFRLPLQLHAVLSHLALSPSDFFEEDFNFGRCLPLELTLMNHSNEKMHVVARPSLLHHTPVDVTLQPLESRVITVEVKLSARALHDDNSVQESIGFFSPENPSNQASCLFSATVKNPLFLTLPEIDPHNSGNPAGLVLKPVFFAGDQIGGFSVTSLRVRNLRDIDIAIQLRDVEGKNHISLQTVDGRPLDTAVIPQQSEETVYVRYTHDNWLFQKSDLRLPSFRHTQNRLQIVGTAVPAKDESTNETPTSSEDEESPAGKSGSKEPHNLFRFSLDYSVIMGIAKFSLSETVMKLQSADSTFHNQSFEFKIQNENPGMKLPYRITVENELFPEIEVHFSKKEGIIGESKYHYISFTLNNVTPGFRSFIIRVRHQEVDVSHAITVLLFTINPSLLVLPYSTSHPSYDSTLTASPVSTVSTISPNGGNKANLMTHNGAISTIGSSATISTLNTIGSSVYLGAVSITKETPDGSFYRTSGSPSMGTQLLMQNTSSDRLCVVPFSDLPIWIQVSHSGKQSNSTNGGNGGNLNGAFGNYSNGNDPSSTLKGGNGGNSNTNENTNENTNTLNSSIDFTTSLSFDPLSPDSIQAFPTFSIENSAIPKWFETQFGYTKSGNPIEIPANQTVKIDITVKPQQQLPISGAIDLTDDTYRGELLFSGDICFFNSRGDNYFQQIVGVTGKYYLEKVEITCQSPKIPSIFVNSSRRPRLDFRIDNYSCAPIQMDLSRLPPGFIPAAMYMFSRPGGSVSLIRQSIKSETPVVEVLENCYETLKLELDMNKVEWKNGENFWNLEFSTLRTPQHVMRVGVSAMVYASALEVRDMENRGMSEIVWNSVEFPSKADVIYSLQLCNICTERIRIIPSFCQLNYSNVFSIVVDETSFELAPATSVVFNLKLHVITINSLDAKQMAELLDTTILAGKLQLVADIARRQFQQDVIRTVVKTPVKVQLQFKPVIAVFPPVLNILTVVEHYSKMEDLLEPHFEENSQTVLSETSEIETNSGSNVSSPICEFSSELEGIDDETPHLRNSVLNTGFVVSRLVRNTVQIQIQNRWRERIQVNLCSTKLEHRKQAVFYSDHETPAFASFIELPEIIVIDPESTVSVLATLLPDFETPIVRIEFSLFHPIEHPRKRVSRGNRAASQRIHRPSSHDSRGNPLLHKSESVLHGR